MEKAETKKNSHNVAHEAVNPVLEFDSNPFTISFRGFGLFAQYAKGVVIAIIVFALINFGLNFVSQFISVLTDTNTSSSQSEDNPFNFDFDNNQENTSIDTFAEDQAVRLDDSAESSLFEFDSEDTSSSSLNLNSRDDNTELSAGAIVPIVLLVLGVLFMITLLVAPLVILIGAITKGVIAAGMMSSVNKKEISFGEAFSQMGSRLGTLFMAELLSGLRILGGYILFIIPGVRAQLRYESVPYIIMSDSDISAGDALKQAKELYSKHLMEIFGIKFVGSVIPVIGSAITAGGVGMSLAQLQAYKKNNQATPKTHWLNYLGLILVGLLFVFIAAIVILVLAIASSS